MTPVELAAWTAAVFLTLSATGAMLGRRPIGTRVVYGVSLALSAALALAAANGLSAGVGEESRLTLPLGLPWIGANLRVDALSSFFLLVLGLGGGAASLYALGYGRHERDPERVQPFFPAFMAGMTLVLLADDAFTFLLSWEFMSLTSWALVMASHREDDTRRAGFVYLTMASFGTLALLFAFGLLAGAGGDYDFATMRAAEHGPLMASAVLALMLLGAGSKAGVVPLHVWLPLAHPAAPSHVSALMSGVMTKVAVYGFIRVAFDLLGQTPWWMSMVVLAIGGVTAVMGVVQALMQHDLKRLLAYHTVENIGIIFIGLGLALAFRADGMAAAAALALTAALFHVLNHSFFKSLLFFGAGAVLTATGTRDMERMGGLIHRMPVTSVTFLAGCVAISALPPFNGFVSEWLTFQAILLSPELGQWGLKITAPAVGGLLALAAALAAACFVKVYGVVFLGRARSPGAAMASEVDRWSLTTMVGLAVLCLAAGVAPGYVIDALGPTAWQLTGGAMPYQGGDPWLTITPIAAGRSTYNGLLVLVFIAVSAGLSAWAVHRFASRRTRRAPAWDCGFPNADPATQYTAGSFAQPIRRVLGPALLNAREEVVMPPPGDMSPARHEGRIDDLIWTGIYARIGDAVGDVSSRLNHLQFLTIRRYLSLVMILLVFLLLVLTLWS